MTGKPPHITQDDWDAISNSPELTEKDFAKALPFAEVFPGLAAKLKAAKEKPAPHD